MHRALSALAHSHPRHCADLPTALQRILEMTARTMTVDRVSIWRFVPDRTAIHCFDLFEQSTQSHSAGTVLSMAAFPEYFRALEIADLISAHDAAADPRTREFAETYLKPLGITSLLDAPLHIGGTIGGVLCHEHVGPPRVWTPDEEAFAMAVANVISLSFESCERERMQSLLLMQSAALDAAADAIAITDKHGVFEWVNPAFCRLTGFTQAEALGKNPRELLKSGRQDRAFYKKLWDTLLEGQVWSGEVINRRKDGSTYVELETITPICSPDGAILHFVAIKRDLTGERQLQAQFLQAQKMDVVGRLSSGIAHDFNNLLTVINGTAELAMMDLPADHPLREEFDKIAQSGKRAAALTRQLLSFSRKQPIKSEPINLRTVVRDFRSIVQRLIGEDIELVVKSDDSDTLVLADVGQIEQVVLNLAVNARDAMPRGGRLTIAVHNEVSDGSMAGGLPAGRRGPAVVLEVADTGTGMSPETMARIFEPFFTTKEAGKGTGLGLATVYSVVSQYGGSIWPTSELGKGTSFKIYLPVAPPAAVGRDAGASKETILVVEGDPSLQEVVRRVLQKEGYAVLTASSSEGAAFALAEFAGPVPLIITDRPLPASITHGRALVCDCGRPDACVQQLPDTIILAKPFTAVMLLGKVHEALSRPAPALAS